ncbi:putative echinoidin-like [Apostichopus japonicus]|uniref:Putative echinoidin-like n=1 Tax=Stichopus japonicus TaxID=307972 RepID=A0A2G8LIC7_STIJA|nr:putative echinoidin-like [Apostichopus japonicus]
MKFYVRAVVLLSVLIEVQVGATSCLCPRPWVPFRDYCYRFEVKKATFKNAEKLCQSYSGEIVDSHLVSIHDSEEGTFLTMTATDIFDTSDVWIGLNDMHEEGNYTWTDGSAYEYRHFADGEPNAAITDEDCIYVYLVVGTWNDSTCNDLNPFVCKRPQWQWANNCFVD